MANKTLLAHATSAATLVAGYVIAFVPAFGKEQKLLISIGTVVFAGVILLSHAIRNRPSGTSVTTATADEIASILKQYDFGPVVQGELAKLVTANAVKGQNATTSTTT